MQRCRIQTDQTRPRLPTPWFPREEDPPRPNGPRIPRRLPGQQGSDDRRENQPPRRDHQWLALRRHPTLKWPAFGRAPGGGGQHVVFARNQCSGFPPRLGFVVGGSRKEQLQIGLGRDAEGRQQTQHPVHRVGSFGDLHLFGQSPSSPLLSISVPIRRALRSNGPPIHSEKDLGRQAPGRTGLPKGNFATCERRSGGLTSRVTQLITVERHHAVEIRMGGDCVLPVASHQPIDAGVGIRRSQGTQEGEQWQTSPKALGRISKMRSGVSVTSRILRRRNRRSP